MKNTTSHKIANEDVLAFILGGKARFTLKSLGTGKNFSYSIKNAPIYRHGRLVRGEENADLKFIKLSTGANKDIKGDYQYIGYISKTRNSWNMVLGTGKSKLPADNPGCVALNFVFNRLMQGIKLPTLEVWHEGICCCCGRSLKLSTSIELGWGPVCLGKREEMIAQLNREISARSLAGFEALRNNTSRPTDTVTRQVRQVLGPSQGNIFSNIPDYIEIKNKK